ncbi:hypothetical protein HOG48_02240 [Candidatus Peregrinibacteria bacterium]|jgi:hypothetical protein|nr:hypothetical protein [Candidatus Peregrinibacteria bacterium]
MNKRLQKLKERPLSPIVSTLGKLIPEKPIIIKGKIKGIAFKIRVDLRAVKNRTIQRG